MRARSNNCLFLTSNSLDFLLLLAQSDLVNHFSLLSESRQLLLLSETLREQVGKPQGRTGNFLPLRFNKKF
ncbi:MAG: hypothetical protein V7K42_16105 [Nostoc sp.]